MYLMGTKDKALAILVLWGHLEGLLMRKTEAKCFLFITKVKVSVRFRCTQSVN